MGAILVGMSLVALVPQARADDHFAAALRIQQAQEHIEAPDIVGPGLNGDTIRLRDFRGKVVFVNFWATWCVPCRREMPGMERLYRDFKGEGLVILAVNLQEPPGPVRAFVRELNLTFPVMLDPTAAAFRKYRVPGIPATYLIDRNQFIVGRAFGAREWDSRAGRAYIRTLVEAR